MRIQSRGSLLAVALIAGGSLIANAPMVMGASAPPPSSGAATPTTAATPVLGPSLLSAQQLADWYASTGVRSLSPTPIATLARLFIDEGRAQGVRGDLAFAQSMLETGYLRYGGQVLPSDHNFSGLGACDACKRGLAFPNPLTGVRAQIQHLWAYASPTARADATARPNVDIRFDLVSPKGKAATWEQMGNGNWATDPDYAGKVLGIYRMMLRSAGIPEGSALAAPAVERIVKVTSSGGAFLADWAPHRSGVAGATTAFGPPNSTRDGAAGCLMRWSAQAVALLSASSCDAPAGRIRWIRVTDGWRTQRGIAVGAKLTRLVGLYPRAKRAGVRRTMVVGRDPGSRPLRTRLTAEVRGGAVRALIITPRAAD